MELDNILDQLKISYHQNYKTIETAHITGKTEVKAQIQLQYLKERLDELQQMSTSRGFAGLHERINELEAEILASEFEEGK